MRVALPFPRIKGRTANAHAARRLDVRAESLRSAADGLGAALGSLLAAATCIVLYRYARPERIEFVAGDDRYETAREGACSFDDESTPRQVAREIDRALDLRGARKSLNLSFPAEHDGEPVEIGVRFSLDEGLTVSLEGDVSLDPAVLERMAGHVETVLSGLAAGEAETPVVLLPLLTDAERRAALVDWNATEAPYRDDATLHQLVEEAVERYAERTALIWGEQRITFAELNKRANRLAHRLIARGIGPESLVGVLLERRPTLIVAVLAVLKAGAGYVPLDPSNPPARLELVLDDSDVELVLTQASLRPLLGESTVPTIDVLQEVDVAYPDTNPELRGTPGNVAYVIYTSGSTGKPKGVVIEHRSLSAFIAWTQKAFSDRELSGVLLSSSIAFDVSVFEIFAPLCSGGRGILVDDILSLPEAPARDRVRMITATASGLSALVNTTTLPRSVQTIFQAGELMHATLAQALHDQPGVTRVINGCGATEDTVYSVAYEVPRGSAENPAIGKPFDNHEAYILDAHMQPVPVGVPGDLYYAGLGLAREYFGRPDLTRERFLPNPIETSSYSRLYRSGDICRYRAGGDMEYVSRADDQLKIRGFRVEISEIEAQLATHPAIADVAVGARKTPVGETILVAYAVLRTGGALTITTLRRFTAERLPEYMIPAALVVLRELPRSATGKLDRRALPDPKFDGAKSAAGAEPDSDVATVLVELWREMLGIDSIGVDQDFFELGGHSLVAVRLLSRIRERFGVTIPLREFFSAPRISAILPKIGAPLPAKAPVQNAPRCEATPSFSQQQLWFLEKILPNHSVYNVPVAVCIRGPLDELALVRALDALLVRHEQLRAAFPDRDGTPLVKISDRRTMPLERIDAAGQDVDELLLRSARKPFDLQTGPLIQATLFEQGPHLRVLLLNIHHIVTDGWSNSILYDELLELYRSYADGREPQLPALRTTFVDYASAERAAAADGLYEADLAYWAKRLAGSPRVELPGDRVPLLVPTFEGERFTLSLEAATVSGVRALARSLGATPSVVLLAAYAALLARYTNEEDLVIGMPTADRSSSELEQIVGYLVGMAALRIELHGDPTFRELVARTAVAMLEGLDHQPVPIQMVVERLAPQRSGLQNPLFALAFVAQTELEPGRAAGTVFEPYPAETKTSKFDLLLDVTEGTDSIRCGFEYATDLYDAARIEDLARSFGTLLESALREPETALSRIPLLEEERRASLVRPPARIEGPRAGLPVYRRFERWARECPDAVALRFGDETTSYGALDKLAARLASRLHDLGAGPGAYVGICAQRSPLAVAAILAVLKSGAAYVPLDPQFPARRLAFIAKDAGTSIVLVDRSSRNFVSEDDARLLILEDMAFDESSAVVDPPGPAPGDPAYVIYTSGSTGTPKGVVVTHRNVARLFAAADSVYRFGPSDIWTLFHSYAFDFSVWELWGALAYGGTLVVVPGEVARSPRDFHGLVRREGVTVLNQTPSAFYAFIAADRAEAQALQTLRYVIFGGEGLDVRRLAPWFERYGEEHPSLVNMYGITETTVHVTHRRIGRNDETRPFGPIGVPLDDLQIYLLDRGGMPAPDGAVGEIFVAGDGVALGYLNRDDLTEQRFIADPFERGRGARIYRSGDLARRLRDGSYEYVGRNDDQVKVRGFRVELGEIEAALTTHPKVAQAAVMADSSDAETRLNAYVVLPDATSEVPADLRAHLAAKLPQHMIPAAFYTVREIPLTENGKLDRRALAAAAEAIRNVPAAAERATPMERKLIELFARALNLDTVGIDDNFFFLGGHSLLAARLVGQVEAAFVDEVSRLRTANGRSPLLATFYVDPTVRGLAASLRRARTFPSGRVIQLRAGAAEKTPLFWFHGMFNGDGLYTWNVIEALDRDRPVWVIHPHGYGNEPFQADIKTLAREQFDLLRSTRPTGPYHIGGFCNGALIAYEVASMLEAQGEVVESLFLVSPPPMVAASERLLALGDGIARLLRVDRRRRVALQSYLYSYSNRMAVFMHANGRERWKLLGRGLTLGIQKFHRNGNGRRADPASMDFADPNFKNDWYLHAIAGYVPDGYSGRVHVVYGRETLSHLGHPSGGWSRLAPEVHVHYVGGGHFCVVDNPEAVGALLSATVEVEAQSVAASV